MGINHHLYGYTLIELCLYSSLVEVELHLPKNKNDTDVLPAHLLSYKLSFLPSSLPP